MGRFQGYLIPPGFVLGEEFNEQGGIVSVPGGAGTGATGQTILVARDIPSGAKAFITGVMARIVDEAAFDQIYISLRRNSAKVIPFDKVSGERIREDRFLDVYRAFDSGLIEVGATNISGTTESGASDDAMAVRVIASWTGFILHPE